MIKPIQNSKKCVACIALGLSLSSVAFADEVTLTGSTLGSFNGTPFAATGSVLDLVYTNSTFDNSTVGGMLDLGGNPAPGSNFNNLGSFSLGTANGSYNGNTFQVEVTFSAPFTIVGGSTAIFSDVITGTVLSGNGGVFVDFDNTPQTFVFTNGAATGSFTMFVNDVSIAPGQDASLTAHIVASQQAVPEPATMVATAGIGLAFLRRKFKKA